MKLQGTLTEQDLQSAAWLHLAPRKIFAALGFLILLLAIWALWLAFSGRAPDTGWGKWGILAILICFLWHYLVYLPYRLKRQFRQYKALQRPQILSTEQAGLTVATENGQGIIPWTDFRSWKENKLLYLLYVTDESYHIVPKRFFASATDVVGFRATLEQSVQRK